MASTQQLRWRKSTRSGGNGGECVELAHTRDLIRDSKNANGPALRADIGTLLDAIRSGALD